MSSAPTLATRYQVRPDVLARELAGDAVLLDLASGRYFGLNPTGRRILELLDGERTLGELVDLLLEEFEEAREALSADVVALAGELEGEGLLLRRDGGE